MNILTAKLNSNDGPKRFVDSFRETGFAVVSDHGIPAILIQKVYSEWAEFFASPSKFDYAFDKKTQAGYFPFRSENAKDSPTKDLKEFYHLYPEQKLPSTFSSATLELRDSLLKVGEKLLGWLDDFFAP